MPPYKKNSKQAANCKIISCLSKIDVGKIFCYRGGLREGKITGRMEELGKMTRKHKLHILYGQSGLASEYTVYVSNSLVTASKAHIFSVDYG